MGDFDVDVIAKRLGDLKALFANKWKDDYLVRLAVFDHLQEVCSLIDKWRKNKNFDTEYEYTKELMDLFILLLFWHVDEKELFLTRVDKFISHIDCGKKCCNTPDIIEILNNPGVLKAVTSVYGEKRMDEYIKNGFLDLCLEQRRVRITEQQVSDDE